MGSYGDEAAGVTSTTPATKRDKAPRTQRMSLQAWAPRCVASAGSLLATGFVLGSVPQLGQASLQKAPLRLLPCQAERALE
jgi:hypothetical protein